MEAALRAVGKMWGTAPWKATPARALPVLRRRYGFQKQAAGWDRRPGLPHSKELAEVVFRSLRGAERSTSAVQLDFGTEVRGGLTVPNSAADLQGHRHTLRDLPGFQEEEDSPASEEDEPATDRLHRRPIKEGKARSRRAGR